MQDLISRQAAIDEICKDWCNTTYKDCKTPFNQETDEYYHCDGCGDVETLLALPSAETPTVSEKHQLSEETPTNTSTNISTDASADRPRPIDPTYVFDPESGVVPLSACEPKGPKTIIYADRPKGHWIVIDEYSACSVCDAEIDWYDLPYCPFCGAKMDVRSRR